MTHRILIADDHENLRKLISLTLQVGDYDLLEAADGVTALKLAQLHRPQVVLLDVMMPGELDGYQVCEKIKADPQLKDVHVIIVTARGQQSDLDTGRAAGADDCMVKPFSPLELLEKVEQVLSKVQQ